MPRIVDHEQRRKELADAARVVVACQGIDALTIARVASATGYSTGVVNHYFPNKRQMLLHTYISTVERARERLAPLLDQSPPDLDLCLKAFLPVNQAQQQEWLLWFSFWGLAVTDKEFEMEQRNRLEAAQTMFQHLFRMHIAHGLLPAEAEAEFLAHHCVTLINGIAVQAVFDMQAWPPQRQCAMIKRGLGLMN